MSAAPFNPKEIGYIITGFTGVVCCNFGEFQGWASKLLGRSLWTHEFADKRVTAEIKEACRPQFSKLAVWCGASNQPAPKG